MSGIYIPGMKMPTTGLYLVSVDSSCGKDETVMTVNRMLGNRDVCLIIGAYNLVPVPEHGRLIDADAIKYTYTTVWGSDDGHNRLDYVVGIDEIDEMPTIIPADKEEQT